MNKQIDVSLTKISQLKDLVVAQWFVYVVKTQCNTLYTGITTDVERRFSEHLDCFKGISKKGAKYFRGREPKQVVYIESCDDRSAASKREYEIKKMSTSAKRVLIDES
ncbi:MAG: putative endonuclease [Pseudohongiellaceae bacterium]|jgi:putative endonuclease